MKKGVAALLFLAILIGIASAQDTAKAYPKNEVSLLYGFPDIIGFRYSHRIQRFALSVKPGLLSWAWGQFSDLNAFRFAPAAYIDYALVTKRGIKKGWIDHKIELGVTPYFDTYKELKFADLTCISFRYLFARSWTKWRLGITAGITLYIDSDKPADPLRSGTYLPVVPMPGGAVYFGRVF